MVSNSLKIELQELLDLLETLRREAGDDPEYQELRAGIPSEWPI